MHRFDLNIFVIIQINNFDSLASVLDEPHMFFIAVYISFDGLHNQMIIYKTCSAVVQQEIQGLELIVINYEYR